MSTGSGKKAYHSRLFRSHRSRRCTEKILAAAFRAPSNDHLRQLEFVVVRGRENIARLVSTVATNTRIIQQAALDDAAGIMDREAYAMFLDALPKQQ